MDKIVMRHGISPAAFLIQFAFPAIGVKPALEAGQVH